ncbi:MAG TPA: hydantoinase B/oxoprolinase family protein [Candidatus Binataceae bacterium]|nr:hydantoinase B/oxoprolinase family protein [Candidatus Binataceae bacterium]
MSNAKETHKRLDPVTFEVLRSSFEYICGRMSTVLQKASFSPIIYDMVDFSNAIYNERLELLGQTANCPVHIAAMHFSAQASVAHFGFESLRPGDIFVLNDPYSGGTHLNDMTFTMPVFHDGDILGFAVSRGHWTDVGGGAAGGQAFGTHIAGEGLRLPPLRMYENYRVNEDLLRIIVNNTRTPQYIKGDLQAHFAALRVAETELQRIAARYGLETVREGMREVLDYTERLTRRAIREIPDGTYRAVDYADTDGISDDPVRIEVALSVDDDRIIVDFEGSDPPVAGGINSPMANTYSAVYYSLKFFLSPDAPANSGSFRPIEIRLPERSWLNAKWPSPTIGCTTLTSSKITAAIWKALSDAIPERAVAPTFAECNWFVCSVKDPLNGENFVFSDLPAGGWGGTPRHDGMSVTQDPLGNCANLSAEVAELLFPIRYEAFDLRADSAGAGRHRGGLGSRLAITMLGQAEVSIETARTRTGSPGVNGGRESVAQRVARVAADGSLDVIGGISPDGQWHNPLRGKRLEAGDRFEVLTTGGGGWGDPLLREPARVLEDFLDDYVSVIQAHELYGVVIDPVSKTVDQEATARERARRRREARVEGLAAAGR